MTIGRSEPRPDGARLVGGRAAFVDDVTLAGLLHARVLRSPHPHARVLRIDTVRARALPGVFCVLTHGEAPTLLCNTVRFAGDRVAVVAAEDPDQAQRACSAIAVEYHVLPAVLDIEEALAAEAPLVYAATDPSGPPAAGEGNVFASAEAETGDLERGLAEAERVFESAYRVGDFQPASVVPRVALTWLDEDGRLMVRTSAENPLQLRQIIAGRLELPVRSVRVVRPRIGGGSGAHQEVLIEDLCGAITLRTGRPVRIEYSRQEELHASRARYPHRITVRSGVRAGRLVALEMRTVLNVGAHAGDALAVAWTAGNRSLSLYRCSNLRHQAIAVSTHLAATGALGGGGWPHGFFAIESHIDEVALALGEDPLEFRRGNHVREGDPPPTLVGPGQEAGASAPALRSSGLTQAIERGARAIGWKHKRRRPPTAGPFRHGVGMAIAARATGKIGIDVGVATLRMNEDGSFNLMVGATDLGNGAEIVLCQIAAETLRTPAASIVLGTTDTDSLPFDAGVGPSSTIHATGRAVQDAARDVLVQIVRVAARSLQLDPTRLVARDGAVHAPDGRCLSYQAIRLASLRQEDQPRLSATASHTAWDLPPTLAAVFAEVEVDIETGSVRVLRLVQAVDCGTVIHPLVAEGRIAGSVIQGLAAAIAHRAAGDPSRMAQRFGDAILARAPDVPEIETIFVPSLDRSGPYGAKVLNDIPMSGVAPAIANAVAQATGARLRELPFLPGRLLAALETQAGDSPPSGE